LGSFCEIALARDDLASIGASRSSPEPSRFIAVYRFRRRRDRFSRKSLPRQAVRRLAAIFQPLQIALLPLRITFAAFHEISAGPSPPPPSISPRTYRIIKAFIRQVKSLTCGYVFDTGAAATLHSGAFAFRGSRNLRVSTA
jgi:hypothetical protein